MQHATDNACLNGKGFLSQKQGKDANQNTTRDNVLANFLMNRWQHKMTELPQLHFSITPRH